MKKIMRKHKFDSFDEEVDLDDPLTYKYLPDTLKELDDLMFKEIGYSLCYMDYLRPEGFKIGTNHNQRERVNLLIEQFSKQRKDRYCTEDIMWFKEQILIFQEEIENMC